MSFASETRIRRLCSAAIEAESQSDVERILAELREAVEDHTKEAKLSLEEQAANIPFLDAI